MPGFDPTIPNISVQQISDPGRRGVTTGRVGKSGTRTFVEVEVSQHDRTFINFEDLEILVIRSGGIKGLLEDMRFGKIGDLARLLTYQKISSNLSNVFYAMQASRADSYAYHCHLPAQTPVRNQCGLGIDYTSAKVEPRIRYRDG
jgi:hypothetical protein